DELHRDASREIGVAEQTLLVAAAHLRQVARDHAAHVLAREAPGDHDIADDRARNVSAARARADDARAGVTTTVVDGGGASDRAFERGELLGGAGVAVAPDDV